MSAGPTAEGPVADGSAGGDTASEIQRGLEALWQQFLPRTLDLVAALQEVADQAVAGILRQDRRRRAEREAHRLAGSLGTFGVEAGSAAARQIEAALQGWEPLPTAEVAAMARAAEQLGEAVHGFRGKVPVQSAAVAVSVRAAARSPADGTDGTASNEPDPGRVLALDDDPATLAAIAAVLEAAGLAVSTVDDPLEFWNALEETGPDLVILDLDLPGIDGVRLCELVRAEQRWSAMPVLFLTATVDRSAVQAIFAAGADDYVAKPFVGPELLTRVTNRLERIRMLRSLAETDPLTGLANRRRLEAHWQRIRSMADRHDQPLSFAVIDLDRFKKVNDTYGHATGDEVLKALGQLLAQRFRGQDLASRWGGEEMALLLYGMPRQTGVARLTEVLEAFRDLDFPGSGGGLHVTFSGGVSQLGRDGLELHDLYRGADSALYRAKASGGAQVLPAAGTAVVERAERVPGTTGRPRIG